MCLSILILWRSTVSPVALLIAATIALSVTDPNIEPVAPTLTLTIMFAFSSLVLISLDAIVKNGQLSGVYTVSQSNTAMLRWLRLGRIYGNQVEVLSGLNSDESYIVSSETKLFNGAKVSIQ